MDCALLSDFPTAPASCQVSLSAPDRRLDSITELAVKAGGADIGGISLLFQSQIWIPSCYGIEASYLPRAGSLCSVAVESGADLFEVADASRDPRFACNPLVAAAGFRRYVALPLHSATGHLFGTLWLMARAPGSLDAPVLAQLRLLAGVAADTLAARYCDPVTGMYNRTVFLHHLQCLVERAPEGGPVSVGYLNLAGFRQVNDVLGRAGGDHVLRQLGERMARWSGAHGLCGHLGGDQFALALEGTDAEVSAALARLCQAMDAPYEPEPGRPYQLRARIGLARHAGAHLEAAGDAAELLDRAEAAAIAAGQHVGPSMVREYDPALRASARLRDELHRLLGGESGIGVLEVHYQPQVDLSGGSLIGLEALVRWRHPALGLIGPHRFIPLAEASGDILALDLQVLSRVCADLGSWLARDLAPVPVALNMSRASLLHPDMLGRLRAVLDGSGVPGRLLEVEVTESLLLESPQLLHERVLALRGLGVRIAVDDFGTGSSNLDAIHGLPFDRLKADRRFVHGVADDPRTAGLLALIRGIADVFGAELLCEGVERQDDLDWLRAQGIHAVQGWYFSRAQPAHCVDGWLARFARHARPAGSACDPAALRDLLH